MPANPSGIPADQPVLYGAEPQLYVSDIERSLTFFTGKLGFDIAFRYGEPAFFAQVWRDGVRLNLRHTDSPVFAPDFRQQVPDALSVMITVSDAAGLHQEFEAAGAVFHKSLAHEPWGADVFIIRDPDGNLIGFAS